MNRYEKKRVLESDIDALIENFLQVRLEQASTQDDARIIELNGRADKILQTINSKGSDIARLFPDLPLHELLTPFYSRESTEPGGMDVFKKRDMLKRQLALLPEYVPSQIKEELKQEIASMESMIHAMRKVPLVSYSANQLGCN